MILGNGIDIVEISRIEKTFNKFGDRFVKKILSSEEIELMPKNTSKIVAFLAKHWAVKEATSKAIGCGLVNGAVLHFSDIVLLKEEKEPFTDKPIIKTNEKILTTIGRFYALKKEELQFLSFHVSTSGDGGFIVASVILELKS